MSSLTDRVGKLAGTTLALAALLAACGGSEGDAQAGGEGEAASESAPAAQVENPATIEGTIRFTGTAPTARTIDMGAEPACAEKHQSAGGAKSEDVVVVEGGLSNVVVHVKEGLPQAQHPTPSDAVTLDQDGCIYKPHVMAVQTGQKINIKNSDGLLHNIKAQPSQNRPFNISQPTNMETTRTFEAAEMVIPIECNVHNWMKAYVAVFDHPYYDVVEPGGKFSIGNLPAGTYTIEAWHETLGTQTAQVTVAPNETKQVELTFAPRVAGAAAPRTAAPLVLDPHTRTIVPVRSSDR